MSNFDWTERFPDLRPIRSAPALMRVNGVGFAVYGSRDHDDETGTYVKTYCFSFLFLPVFALSAYRVADAPNGGWYFIGRVPISGFAKGWNLLLLLVGLGLGGVIGWKNYTTSPEYVARQKLGAADNLVADGKIVQAANLYREVATGGAHRGEAGERLRGLLDDPQLHTSLRDAASVFQIVRDMRPLIGGRNEDLEERGTKLIEQHADNDPRGALALVTVLSPIAAEPRKLAARRQSLLEQLVAREPNDLDTVSALALHYEETNQSARCEELLTPRKDRLGDSEGARILGHLLVRKNKAEDACTLLERYTDRHLPELEVAESDFQAAMTGMVNQINNGFAPGFPYDRLKAADKAGRMAILTEYRESRLRDDPNLRQLQDKYQEARRVVPAALDLGILLLRRAQTRPDAATREADLKKAEKVFLAIEKDEEATSKEYRVSLGRVYYWLGKHQEGRKKFDEVLAAENRSYQMLMYIGYVLREVGARGEACTLVEEAYNKEQDRDKKFQAAISRYLLALELDEKIVWLQRSNPEDPDVKANLCEAKAEQALRENKVGEAEEQLRQAIDLYSRRPESAAILNNSALVHLSLYHLTGDKKLLDKASTMMDRAVALSPRDSILLGNAASALIDAALRDVVGDAIDLKAIKQSIDHSLLAYLYADQAGKDRVIERLRSHPATVKATSFLERLLILSPKSPHVYRRLRSLYDDQRNVDKLRELSAALEKGQPDFSAEQKTAREYFAGQKDEMIRKESAGQMARLTKVVKETEAGRRGLTYAVAAAELAELQMRLDMAGQAVNADEVVSLAEAAHAAAPSDGTRRRLELALLFRAGRTLAKNDPAYAALASRTHRTLEPKDQVAVTLMKTGKPRKTVLDNADVKRVVELVRQSRQQFPGDPSKWAWAILRAVDNGEAEQLAKVIRADRLEAVLQALDVKLSPYSAATAVRAYWSRQVAGDEASGRAILKQFAARGVPMPDIP